MTTRPTLVQTVLDATDARELAEFYRELLGLVYRSDSEPPTDGSPDTADWLVLLTPDAGRALAFQKVDTLPRTNWPDPPGIPQQLHVDMSVGSVEELRRQRDRVLALGGEVRDDRTGDAEEPLYVFVDPAGHPFCVFVV